MPPTNLEIMEHEMDIYVTEYNFSRLLDFNILT